jgi:oligoribonuclease
VRAAVLAYVRDRVPAPHTACLAGNTVHADKAFLAREMPELIRHLHYRIVDVSTLKELVRRWHPAAAWQPPATTPHRALADITASIVELRYYRTLFHP